MDYANSVIAVGGSSRTVAFYDVRSWNAITFWKNCVKYDVRILSRMFVCLFVAAYSLVQIVSVRFSTHDNNICYVSDDNIVSCRQIVFT